MPIKQPQPTESDTRLHVSCQTALLKSYSCSFGHLVTAMVDSSIHGRVVYNLTCLKRKIQRELFFLLFLLSKKLFIIDKIILFMILYASCRREIMFAYFAVNFVVLFVCFKNILFVFRVRLCCCMCVLHCGALQASCSWRLWRYCRQRATARCRRCLRSSHRAARRCSGASWSPSKTPSSSTVTTAMTTTKVRHRPPSSAELRRPPSS